MLLWTPAYDQSKAGRPARTFIQQLCDDTGCNPDDLPKAMNDREDVEREGQGYPCLPRVMMMMMIYIYIYSVCVCLSVFFCLCINPCIYQSSYVGMCVCVWVCVRERERERERERKRERERER